MIESETQTGTRGRAVSCVYMSSTEGEQRMPYGGPALCDMTPGVLDEIP